MAKIVKRNGDKYRIKFVPKGNRDLYKNPYRFTTVVGKTLADQTVSELTAIEIIDSNERKIGKTDIQQVKSEIKLHELFDFFRNSIIPYCEYAEATKVRYLRIMDKFINDFGPDFLFKDISYKLIIDNYATGQKNQCIIMIKCINHIGAVGRQAISGQLDVPLDGFKISSFPIKHPKIVKGNKNPLSRKQLNQIYDNQEINEVTKDIMRLYIMTGCRLSELVRPYFTWDQIHTVKQVAYVKTKGNKKAHDKLFEIPWTDKHQELIGRIAAHYKNEEHPEAHIYPIPVKKTKIYYRMAVASKKAGIHFTPHDLRDTGATMILRATGNIYAAKEFCGHKSVKDTEESYADYNIYDKKNATNQLINHLGGLL